MIVQQESSPAFAVNGAGLWELQSNWLLQPRKIPSSDSEMQMWLDTVRAWIPAPGSPWRIPCREVPGFSEDGNWVISSAGAVAVPDSTTYTYRISLHALPGGNIRLNNIGKNEEFFPPKAKESARPAGLLQKMLSGTGCRGSEINHHGITAISSAEKSV